MVNVSCNPAKECDMPHDVFISYSSHDKSVADAVCAKFESQQIRCWIAPRDIRPGAEWGEALINAIGECKVVVLIFSTQAQDSPQVKREIERAVSKGKPIVTLRIEDILPTGAMEFALSSTHWLDALTPPLERHIAELLDTIQRILDSTLTLAKSGLPTRTTLFGSRRVRLLGLLALLLAVVAGRQFVERARETEAEALRGGIEQALAKYDLKSANEKLLELEKRPGSTGGRDLRSEYEAMAASTSGTLQGGSSSNFIFTSSNFVYTVNGDRLTIARYTGPGGAVIIPSIANGKTVNRVGIEAFLECTNVTSVIIPDGVIFIDSRAFAQCSGLTNISIPTSVNGIGAGVFWQCSALASVTIPNSVKSIGQSAFAFTDLRSVTIPSGVTSVKDRAFMNCTNLTKIEFLGDAPSLGQNVFEQADKVTVYYLRGTTGWGKTFGSRPTAPFGDAKPVAGQSKESTVAATLFDGFSCTTNGENLVITKYTGSGGVIVIPSTINGKTVTGIGTQAFEKCSTLTSVTIPNSVTSIARDAFRYCTGLTGISIPNSVTSIGDRAFGNCASLTSAIIGNSVTNIEPYTFSYCSSMETITIPESVVGIGSHAFERCGRLTTAVIGNGVASIGDSAFSYCNSLKKVYFKGNAPGSLFVGNKIFQNADKVIVCYLPETAGWGEKFEDRPTAKFQELELRNGAVARKTEDPQSVQIKTGAGAKQINPSEDFSYTANGDNLTITGYNGPPGTVVIPSTINGKTVTSIGEEAFGRNPRLREAVIPDSVTNIGARAFKSCGKLESITVGKGVTRIGDKALGPLVNLTEIKFLGNAPVLEGRDVYVSSDKAIIYYQAGTTGWGPTFGSRPTALLGTKNPLSGQPGNAVAVNNESFEDFTYTANGDNLTITKYNGSGGAVVIPSTINGKTVTSIGKEAFLGCSSLTSVTIPDGVTSIELRAFAKCTRLTGVMIPNSVTRISQAAFWQCSALVSISIPNRVRQIGPFAFSATGLTSITIPDSVASIGSCVFMKCTNLTQIRFLGDAPSLGLEVFTGANKTPIHYSPETKDWGQTFELEVFKGADKATVYYSPGTKGWGATFGGRPTKASTP